MRQPDDDRRDSRVHGSKGHDMPRTLMKFIETRHEVRLDFSESAESRLARLRELSGTRLPVGQGLNLKLHVTLESGECRNSGEC